MPRKPASPPPPKATLPDDAKLIGKSSMPGGIRFSLRTLMLVATAICLLLGLGSILPAGLTLFLCASASLIITSMAATGIVFAHAERKAFCIGVLLAMLFSMWTESGSKMLQSFMRVFMYFPWVDEGYRYDSDWMSSWVLVRYFVQFAIAGLNGYLCVRAQRYFDRTSNDAPWG